jgi:SAM-dependent methyltransferase
MQSEPTHRFSDRVDDYVKFRPGYPSEFLQTLLTKYGLKPSHTVVDVGSGTGISSEIFLKNGNLVFAVEPNQKMRSAAESLLSGYAKFNSIEGTAESTGLAPQCADFVVVAQAFHWFSPMAARDEFRRILRDGGHVVILFNDRHTSGSNFAVQYEALLQEFGTDYKDVKHKNVSEARHREFLGEFDVYHFSNDQQFDYQGILGRLKSSSYAPKEGHPRFEEMVQRLLEIFTTNAENGMVVMANTTQVFVSRLA